MRLRELINQLKRVNDEMRRVLRGTGGAWLEAYCLGFDAALEILERNLDQVDELRRRCDQ